MTGVRLQLRTPNAGNANNVRICNTGNGGALNNNANNSNGVAPIERIVRFEYRNGKQCVSLKEFVSRFRKERKGLWTVASFGMIHLYAAVIA